MNWSKIKSIMIYFLIAMNLFMLAAISFNSVQKSSIPQEVIDAAVKVLKNDGFECSAQNIPKVVYNLPELNAAFYSAAELSDVFFGKQLAFKTSENSLVASSGRSTLTVSEKHFRYNSGYSSSDKHSAKKIKRALQKAGINMKGSVYDDKAKCFYLMYNDTNLFNMYIKAKLDDDGELSMVEAQWPKELSTTHNDDISFVKSITKIKTAFPNGGKIDNIELGYSLHSLGGESYIFIPSWRLMVDGNLKILE